MRRWARYTFNAAAVLSLVLCVATVALGVGSFRRKVTIARSLRSGETEVSLFISRGRIVIDNAPDVARDNDRLSQLDVAITRHSRAQLAIWEVWRSRRLAAGKGSTHATDTEEGLLSGELDRLRANEQDVSAANSRRAAWRPTTPWSIEYASILPLGIGAFAVPPLLLWRRVRRVASGALRQMCVVCGYDLRATPDRCPECGTIPPCAASPATPSTP